MWYHRMSVHDIFLNIILIITYTCCFSSSYGHSVIGSGLFAGGARSASSPSFLKYSSSCHTTVQH